jgi:DNA-binding MurR/RpiR family transcriptional regulator
MSKHIGIDAEDQLETHGEDFLEDSNAMLEAAGVPELLEVLSKAIELLEQSTEIDFDGTAHIAISSEDSCAMRKIIESAIAKARGEEW